MRPILPLVVLCACQSDVAFGDRETKISVNPPLLDLGDVAVGTVEIGELLVDHLDGPDGTIRDVSVVNLVGDTFSYDGAATILVPQGTEVPVPITFAPMEPGWFTAHVTITHTGIDETHEVDVRGHGVEASATLDPLAIDFGAVPVGGTEGRDVTLTNGGLVDLLVSAVSLSHPAYDVGIQPPVAVEAGGQLTVPVRFTPLDPYPVTASMTVAVGGVDLPRVVLRGNDCDNGLPEAYDEDEDGFTSCGGDCDDSDPDVRPGVPEVADGVDEDCDGLIDEGTDAYDDDGDGHTELGGDCNDADVAIAPAPTVTEIPDNGIDDDCDGVVDLGATDNDGDGFSPTPGAGDDCNDNNLTVHPGAIELPDGLDNDCDGTTDEGTTLYDDDGDGVSEAGGDCNDADATAEPGAPELADGQDSDCDGVVDEGTVNYDDDGDGYTETGGDCDDADPSMNPGQGTCP